MAFLKSFGATTVHNFPLQSLQGLPTVLGFNVTSSLRYAQSNGQVERMVQTEKKMIIKSDDPYLAMMSYRQPLIRGAT